MKKKWKKKNDKLKHAKQWSNIPQKKSHKKKIVEGFHTTTVCLTPLEVH